MHSLKFTKRILFIIASLLLAMNVCAENKDTLVIGKVSVNLSDKDHGALMSLANDIVPQLNSEGIEKADVYLAKSVDEMIAAIRAGAVDWVSDSLFVSLLLAENTRSDAFLSKFRNVKRYSAVFFVRKNSEIESIADVKKKIVLFKDKISSTRYFVPYYELTSHGYIPIVYGETGDESGKKKNVFYKFEKDPDSLIQKIMGNALTIGVLSNEEYASLANDVRSGLKIIHQTVGYPETLDLIRSDLDIDLKLKLKKLLRTSRDINTQQAKKEFTELRFENFIAEGRDGYVFLRGIIKHDVVPTNIKKTMTEKDLKEIEDQQIYERIMAEP